MYKIYINETPLWLVNTGDLDNVPDEPGEMLKARYAGKSKFLLHYVDMLEKTNRFSGVVIYAQDEKKLFADFKSLYKKIAAAGGLVFNEEGKALLIYRRGWWDLPKGKIDKGEKKKEAAIREVQEETGIKQITIEKKITNTYHTYKLPSGKRVLKKTYWYLMKTKDSELVPETEEDIEIAEWRKLDEFLGSSPKVYRNILEIIRKSSPKE